MRFAVACDHAGFPMKATVIAELEKLGHQVEDLGAYDDTASDYPDYAEALGLALAEGRAERGILLCGSGVGACIAVNKIPGVRAAMCHDTFSARQGVEDDDMNALCLGARIIGPELAKEIVRAFQSAQFSGLERHRRRLEKVLAIEKQYTKARRTPDG